MQGNKGGIHSESFPDWVLGLPRKTAKPEANCTRNDAKFASMLGNNDSIVKKLHTRN